MEEVAEAASPAKTPKKPKKKEKNVKKNSKEREQPVPNVSAAKRRKQPMKALTSFPQVSHPSQN